MMSNPLLSAAWLGHPRPKDRRAARNFVASMIGLVRGINDGLDDQRLMDSFNVDEGGGA
jgi:hypothetical protein